MAMLAPRRSVACAPTFRPKALPRRSCRLSCSSSASLIPLPVLSGLASALTARATSIAVRRPTIPTRAPASWQPGRAPFFLVQLLIPLRVCSASFRQRAAVDSDLAPCTWPNVASADYFTGTALAKSFRARAAKGYTLGNRVYS